MVRDKGEELILGALGEEPERQPAGPKPVSVADESSESLAQLWGSLFLSPERAAPKTILVTSAESGEGVTQVAAGLGLTGQFGEHGLRIALVDFNVTRPGMAGLFGIAASPGVLEVLTRKAALGPEVIHSHAPWLDVIPAGEADEGSLPLLRSQGVGELIRWLADHYDHVVIDAPAVNHHAAARTLAGLTDGVLLVVKAGVTRREAVAEAKKRIEYAQGRVIGVVLNQRKFPIPGFLYRRL